jgi:hypothetical protein
LDLRGVLTMSKRKRFDVALGVVFVAAALSLHVALNTAEATDNWFNAGIANFSDVAAQTAPTSGIKLTSTQRAGWSSPTSIGSGELNIPLQSSINIKRLDGWFGEQGQAAIGSAGGLQFGTATGTLTARNLTTTNLCTTLRRTGYVSASSSGAATGQRTNLSTGTFLRGSATGEGGFFCVGKFMVSDATIVTTGRTFMGLQSSGAAPTDQDPAAETNVFGVGNGSGDTNLKMYMSGAAAQTPVNLGASFPVNGTTNTDCYELDLYAPPNASYIGWQVTDMATGAGSSGTQSTSANLVSSGTLLYPTFWRSNSTTAAAVGIDLISFVCETDY